VAWPWPTPAARTEISAGAQRRKRRHFLQNLDTGLITPSLQERTHVRRLASGAKLNGRAVGYHPVQLLNLRIRHRNAANRPVDQQMCVPNPPKAVAHTVDHDVPARRVSNSQGARGICGRRVGHVQRQVELTGRVMVIDNVTAFWRAAVTLTPLRTYRFSSERNPIGAHQRTV